MWNCNSITSWLLAVAGADVERIAFPVGGRAPGWDAGLVVARRHSALAATQGRAEATRLG
jgi:hypothetical protein